MSNYNIKASTYVVATSQEIAICTYLLKLEAFSIFSPAATRKIMFEEKIAT